MKRANRVLMIAAGMALGFLAMLPAAQAQTEDVCADEAGAAYGLCTAYCQAMDCDAESTNANEIACKKVREKYFQLTGEDIPCERICSNAVIDFCLKFNVEAVELLCNDGKLYCSHIIDEKPNCVSNPAIEQLKCEKF